MSGPYGPSDTPGPGEGRPNDPTQQWSGGQQQPPGQAGPTQQWGQQPGGAQPTQQWGGQQGGGQWGQQQPGQQWGQPPQQPQWGQQSQPSWPQQQPPQQQAWEPTQQQWGQQPPQQPGQPQWGQQQPGQQWGQQQPGLQPTGAKKSKKGPLIGGVVALVVVVVAVVLGVVFLSSDKLDNKAVQDGVQKVLKDSYGIDDVQNVSCPSGQKVEVGKSFDCTLKVGGEQKKVTVKITKDDGTYEVGRPN
ncbi:DUF4333 domain-containing protein [Nocardia blacklockiae]|uniref:DUF4333 domain-containing protein n=1 Tax=Nocardia blacklockiae TaxID=480036 RepID=UPI001895CF11|nr:DUF4333 domain-containing protein [Nocardia blacklockiae]MBF6170541.1 DUF4333 domain-containing protein [Nocardia blacklockiae]